MDTVYVISTLLQGDLPNGHAMSNPRRFNVDITWIRRRPNFDEFPIHFRVLFRCNFDGRKIHVVSTYFFRCNFDGRKTHIVSTYLFRCNFDGGKIHIVSMYFYQCNFDGWNMHVLFTYFFRQYFDGERFDIIFGKLWANENIWEGFPCICNFKLLTFARLFSINVPSKSPWCSPVPLKFESYNLHHCKKNCCKLVFLVFTEQLL